MNKITILPDNKIIELDSKTDLRMGLIQAGFPIKSTCGGCASCGTCVIKVVAGDENLSEISFEEKQLLGNVFHITKERLSCQATISGHVTIDITEHKTEPVASKPKTLVRKSKEIEENKLNQEQTEKPIKEGGFKKPRAFSYDSEDES